MAQPVVVVQFPYQPVVRLVQVKPQLASVKPADRQMIIKTEPVNEFVLLLVVKLRVANLEEKLSVSRDHQLQPLPRTKSLSKFQLILAYQSIFQRYASLMLLSPAVVA